MLGMIAVADVIKEDSPRAVKELQNMGIRVVMLTGDNERTARAIGAQAGVDEVIAGVLPDGKEAVISRLKEKGKVAMVGDGINDAPALTSADIGIAIGAGTDIAIDAADVVLMKSRLSDVPAAIRLSRATLRNIHENLFWAFIYNIIGIPLAAGVWIPLFGWKLNPMFGAAAMSLSSFCVVMNALRLNLFHMHAAKRDTKRKKIPMPEFLSGFHEKQCPAFAPEKMEVTSMKKTILIICVAAACILLGLVAFIGLSGRNKNEEQQYRFYYINSDETRLKEEKYTPEKETTEVMLRNFSESLNNRETRENGISLFPDGVKISSYSIQDGVLNIEFNEAYDKMSRTRETSGAGRYSEDLFTGSRSGVC